MHIYKAFYQLFFGSLYLREIFYYFVGYFIVHGISGRANVAITLGKLIISSKQIKRALE
jgi:hypothetical protein